MFLVWSLYVFQMHFLSLKYLIKQVCVRITLQTYIEAELGSNLSQVIDYSDLIRVVFLSSSR